jgi:N-acetylmuramoyl-L-alanine amidase
MLLSTATLCLALNIYHEARGEPLEGQIAVANVTLNRAGNDRRRVCSVVTEYKQFSWTQGAVKFAVGRAFLMQHARPKDMKAWKQSLRVASHVLKGGADESWGATHYHASRVKPNWRLDLQQTRVIGKHIFLQGKVWRP